MTGYTPMLKQYFEMRQQHPEALLAMRVGDFYEFYGPDAEQAAEALDISLTGREDGPNGRIAMAGVPFHSVEKYLTRLMQQGFKVALCDQLEDPRLTKKLVKRGITRVLTPGTVIDDSMLSSAESNYLCAIYESKGQYGLASLDAASGEFAAVELTGSQSQELLTQELARIRPSEMVVPAIPELQELAKMMKIAVSVTIPPKLDQAERILKEQFQSSHLAGFGLEAHQLAAIASASIILYARHVKLPLEHVTKVQVYDIGETMRIDPATRAALELTRPLGDGKRAFTLLGTLDCAMTPGGKRLLSKWIDQPVLSIEVIESRLDAVERLVKHPGAREGTRSALKGLGDLERPVSRCCAGIATPLDLGATARILLQLPKLDDPLRLVSLGRIQELRDQMGDHHDLATKLKKALSDSPSVHIREGSIIRPGFDEELDRTRQMSKDAKGFIAQLETQEKEATGINSLKIRFNNVFGYYLEIPKRNSDQVPPHYVRKQTTANAERYITAELKEQESTVLSAAERALSIEVDLFNGLRDEVARNAEKLQQTARAVSEVDCLASLAETAMVKRYVRPKMVQEDVLKIEKGRHPVVEAQADAFIPNGIGLTEINCSPPSEEPTANEAVDGSPVRAIVLTGPNMAGKSTYLRQVALTVIMAQMGSFVPADSCTVGLCDRVFARIGARDDLAAGQSTFMVEMIESANILNNATDRSLVILDEIGRGTATYDGLAIAWSMMEQLVSIGSKTLFATHYHQLNKVAETAASVRNFRVAVKEVGDHVVWTHQVMPGGADRSYGIQVAKMAGMPHDVLARATEILAQLEGNESTAEVKVPPPRRLQYTLFEMEASPIERAIQSVDVNKMSPMDALALLDRLKRQMPD